MKQPKLLACLLMLALPVSVMAQSQHTSSSVQSKPQSYSQSSSHSNPQSGSQTYSPSSSQSQAPTEVEKAYMSAMNAMHTPMMKGVMNPDPDVAFIQGMIPHHQGAIDMAKIVIKYGKDPEVRKLAEQVIQAQEAEIVWMKQWLAAHQVAEQAGKTQTKAK